MHIDRVRELLAAADEDPQGALMAVDQKMRTTFAGHLIADACDNDDLAPLYTALVAVMRAMNDGASLVKPEPMTPIEVIYRLAGRLSSDGGDPSAAKKLVDRAWELATTQDDGLTWEQAMTLVVSVEGWEEDDIALALLLEEAPADAAAILAASKALASPTLDEVLARGEALGLNAPPAP